MLEDDFNDCLSKAICGHGGSIAYLARASEISESRISSCISGKEDPAVINSLAPHLQLHAGKLLALKSYTPIVNEVLGLKRLVSPFGHLGVNAYIVHYGDTVLIFDTGTDSSSIHELVPNPTALFITHEHPDHTKGVPEFTHTKIYQPSHFKHADTLKFGKIQLKVLDVSGHCNPSRAYFITGLTQPICIVGDSLFAGSIGKCADPDSYSAALANIRDHLFSLPSETILCPGHGPMTTIKQEKLHNPFF